MKRICFVISSLSHGGAERVVSILANHWAETETFQVSILLLGPQENQFYPLSPKVHVHSLNLMGKSDNLRQGLKNNISRIFTLRRELRRTAPDTVISFLFNTNILSILASTLCSWKLIISERNHPHFNRQGKAWDFLRPFLYRLADTLVVQTPEINRVLGFTNLHTVVIPNPLIPLKTLDGNDQKDYAEPSHKLVAVGSFTPQKRFDVLLRAFALARQQVPDAQLTIAGTGPLKSDLEKLARSLNITSAVHFPGVVKNVAQIFKDHDVFVMSSDFEGFPNALIEAMGFGMPSISTDCPSGPSDIISHGTNGLLVPTDDPVSLSLAMVKMLVNPAYRGKMGLEALKIRPQLSISAISEEWCNIIS